MRSLETDYLVIGAGASGLAFVDTLLDEGDAHVTLVDRRGLPGGHWNDAYPFVTLHQPAAFYGVNSQALGRDELDRTGHNAGMMELATGPEICGYYRRLLQGKLLSSGRVDWHPFTEAELPEGEATEVMLRHRATGERTRVVVRRRVVDARYLSPFVPSTHQRRFSVAEGAEVVPPNALADLPDAARAVCVIGAGKTAMDTLLWLMDSGMPVERLHWVVPRSSWVINRLTTQPGPGFFFDSIGGQVRQLRAAAEATSVDDLYLRLEAAGQLLRVHTDVAPGMFHLATLTEAEVQLLRQVRQVIRLGRVQRVEPDALALDGGRAELPPGTLYVDCTASAVEPRPLQPIFQGQRIVLQMVRLPQPTFSAALIAYVEAHYDGDKAKNALCGTVPFPHKLADYPRGLMGNLWNQFQWGQDKALRQWVRDSRLDGFGRLMSGIPPEDTERLAVMAEFKAVVPAAMANLQKLVQAG